MTTDLLATLVQHSGLGSYSKGEVITKQEGDPSGRWKAGSWWRVYVWCVPDVGLR